MGFFSGNFEFSLFRFLIVAIYTFALFYLVVRSNENMLKKIFLMFFAVSYFVYSGAGISVMNEFTYYPLYFSIYTIVLVAFLYLFRKRTITTIVKDEDISSVINKYGKYILFIYPTLILSLLVFPENKLSVLFNPPTVDINSVMDVVTLETGIDAFTAIVMVLKYILQPFYYLSLVKLKNKPIQLLFLIIAPLYFIYCKDEYIARTDIMLNFIYYVCILYYFNPDYRKKILFFSGIMLVLSVFFLAAYTSIRIGEKGGNMSFWTSIESLFAIEGTFPLWFDSIYNKFDKSTFITDYSLWIVTQPIPGFLKSWLVDFNLNISIAKVLLDVDSSETVSFVPLTGLVCESVFIFGKYLFFIHAIILAYILNIFANFLTSRDSFKTLMIYAIVFTCLGVSRAGTSGSVSYPFILKALFYVPLILFMINIKKYVKYK
jgi:hypothetical protein